MEPLQPLVKGTCEKLSSPIVSVQFQTTNQLNIKNMNLFSVFGPVFFSTVDRNDMERNYNGYLNPHDFLFRGNIFISFSLLMATVFSYVTSTNHNRLAHPCRYFLHSNVCQAGRQGKHKMWLYNTGGCFILVYYIYFVNYTFTSVQQM